MQFNRKICRKMTKNVFKISTNERDMMTHNYHISNLYTIPDILYS